MNQSFGVRRLVSRSASKPTSIFSPPARWGLLDFMLVARLLPSSLSPFLPPFLPSFSSSSYSSPDLICQLSIAVVLAGSHLPFLDSESLSAVGLAGPQPARVWAPWASPDFNWRESERTWQHKTTTIMRPLHCDVQPESQETQRITHTWTTTRCRTQRRNRSRSVRPQPHPSHRFSGQQLKLQNQGKTLQTRGKTIRRGCAFPSWLDSWVDIWGSPWLGIPLGNDYTTLETIPYLWESNC